MRAVGKDVIFSLGSFFFFFLFYSKLFHLHFIPSFYSSVIRLLSATVLTPHPSCNLCPNSFSGPFYLIHKFIYSIPAINSIMILKIIFNIRCFIDKMSHMNLFLSLLYSSLPFCDSLQNDFILLSFFYYFKLSILFPGWVILSYPIFSWSLC